jgi:hypothetical protein
MFIDRVRFRESEEDSVEPRLLPPRAAGDANERTFVEETRCFFSFFKEEKPSLAEPLSSSSDS